MDTDFEMCEELNLSSYARKLYLKEKREQFDLKQYEMAKLLSMKTGTYRKYEEFNRGARNISDKVFEEAVKIIRVYEHHTKGKIRGKIVLSEELQAYKDVRFPKIFTDVEMPIANAAFNILYDRIKFIEEQAEVPYFRIPKKTER